MAEVSGLCRSQALDIDAGEVFSLLPLVPTAGPELLSSSPCLATIIRVLEIPSNPMS